MILIADCNEFYCSCEKVFNPALYNKPVAVLSNNDKCIVALDKKCKELGLKRGVSVKQVRDTIEKNGVVLFSSNYNLYGDMSDRVMSVLHSFVPEMEIYSIDYHNLIIITT